MGTKPMGNFVEQLLDANLRNVLDLIKTLQRIERAGNCRVITLTEVKVLVKGRKGTKFEGVPTPAHLQGLGKFTNQVASIGNDFYSIMKRNGADVEKYHEVKKEYVPTREADPEFVTLNGIVQRNIKNPDQKYCRVFPSLSSNDVEVLLVDAQGNPIEVTAEEKDAYFDPRPTKDFHKPTDSQAASGGTKNPEPRDYKLEGILYLQKGAVIANAIAKPLQKLLNLTEVD